MNITTIIITFNRTLSFNSNLEVLYIKSNNKYMEIFDNVIVNLNNKAQNINCKILILIKF